MANLDPATLEKFQKFQAMLAESPEIVAALNSPEILALAAKAAGKKNLTTELDPTPAPVPEQQYPMVGYGVSDDVSVMSEMTTPTVMTRQSVEEDEFYPEVDGEGASSSGLFGGPRRIGLKIGVSASEEGDLPPPPPKSKTRSSTTMRRSRASRKSRTMAPMSKIIENNDVVSIDSGSTTDSDPKGKPPLMAKKGNCSPKRPSSLKSPKEKSEPHPFFGIVGAGTVSRPARHNSYNNRARRTKGRGVNRNRSMPTNIKMNSESSNSLGEDDNTKSSGDGNSALLSNGSSSSSSSTNGKLKSKAGLSPTRSPTRSPTLTSEGRVKTTGIRKSFGSNGSKERGINRNRSMPLKALGNEPLKVSSHDSSSSRSWFEEDDDDDDTKTSSEGDDDDGDDDDGDVDDDDDESSPSTSNEKLTPKEAQPPPRTSDGRGSFQSTRSSNSRGKSVPRMRLVPVVSKSVASVVSAESSPAKMTRSDNQRKPRSRSLSKYSSRNFKDKNDDDNDDDRSRCSEPAIKSVASAESNPSKMLRSDDQRKPRSRSLSKYSSRKLKDDKNDDRSRSSEPVKFSKHDGKKLIPTSAAENFQSDAESDDIDSQCSSSNRNRSTKSTKAESYDSYSSSDDSKGRPSVSRRWKPPSVDKSTLPPAFRLSSSDHSLKPSSNHSIKSSSGSFRLSGSSDSLKSKKLSKPGSRLGSNYSNSREQNETRTEEQNATSSSDDEQDYVRQTVRKSGKARSSHVDKNSTFRPDPEQFKQNLSEIHQVIQGRMYNRPSDYVGEGSPFGTRKKRPTKKKSFGNSSETSAPRSTDWLGSGKAQKRTWKAKAIKDI